MKKLVVYVSILCFLLVQCAQNTGKTLDGKSFKISIADVQQADKQDPDVISFQNGKLDSESCHQYGFTAADYQVEVINGNHEFVSTISSPTEGKMTIKGTVKGDVIEGTMVWMKEGQADIHYTFKGSIISQ
jgi:hypothetical protein